MNGPQYFTKRSHLPLAILVAIIVLIILTLVAARILSTDRPPDDQAPSTTEQTSGTTPSQ